MPFLGSAVYGHLGILRRSHPKIGEGLSAAKTGQSRSLVLGQILIPHRRLASRSAGYGDQTVHIIGVMDQGAVSDQF